MQPQGRTMPNGSTEQAYRPAATLAPFYTLGGPTTQFAGNGVDPWSEAGWGNKRARLRGQGVTEEDWMWRTALDCRQTDLMLKQYRLDRLQILEGDDATKGWVYALEEGTEKATEGNGQSSKPTAPSLERKRSGLIREVDMGDIEMAEEDVQAEAVIPGIAGELGEQPRRTSIVVQTANDDDKHIGSRSSIGSWKPGIVYAAYEVCLVDYAYRALADLS